MICSIAGEQVSKYRALLNFESKIYLRVNSLNSVLPGGLTCRPSNASFGEGVFAYSKPEESAHKRQRIGKL